MLRVIEPLTQVTDIVGVDTEEWYRKAQENVKTAIKKYVSGTADKMKKEGINAKGVVLEGRAGDEILDYAKSNKIDLIVISTHGRSGVSRWVMGSVADKVLRHSSIPVLIATPPACRVA